MSTTETRDALDLSDEDWKAVLLQFPEHWEKMAMEHGAVERLRGFDSIETLLRTLLLHLGNGYSLRECAATAQAAGWVDSISDVALLKRLRKSEEWLRHLCLKALEDAGLEAPATVRGLTLKVVDGSVIKETGKTGSSWLMHYCMNLPTLHCSHFELTPVKGAGNGEKLTRFPVHQGECILGDAAYCDFESFAHVEAKQAYLITRYCSGTLSLCNAQGQPWELLEQVKMPETVAEVAEATAYYKGPAGEVRTCRLCILRRSQFAVERAIKRLKRREQKDGTRTRGRTLELAKYSIIATNLPKHLLDARGVLDWYRFRWQIEMLFKRLKSIAELGCLPKRDPTSSRAWLYGKFLTCLIVEKLIREADQFSPWGYRLEKNAQPVA